MRDIYVGEKCPAGEREYLIRHFDKISVSTFTYEVLRFMKERRNSKAKAKAKVKAKGKSVE